VPVFTARYEPACLRSLDGAAEQPPDALRGATLRLLCGIAQPRGFARTVEALGARVVTLEAYPDHHPYDDAHLARLVAELIADVEADAGLRRLTTEKDAVKLAGRLPDEAARRLWVLEMAVQPDDAARAFFFDFIRRRGLH
jgi:tetraacyldisaccharide 4'-kinase